MSKTDSVSVQMKEVLDEVNKEVREAGIKGINKISKESVSKLRNTSPKKTGSYARGWATKKEGEMDVIVHNKTDYQLTHLLENGHVIRNKKGTYGRTSGKKHIKPVEEWAVDALPEEIMRNIK